MRLINVFKRFKVIAKAWITAANPTPEEKEIAEYRLTECNGCKARKRSIFVPGFHYCSKCGCPLNRKIFAESKNECPDSKWEK